MLVAYLACPLGDNDIYEALVQHGDNVANGLDWFKFLITVTKWSVMCPWLVYETVLNHRFYGPRIVVDNAAFLERSDLLVLVGSRVNPHMKILSSHANIMNKPILSLLDAGTKPPWEQMDQWRGAIKSRAQSLGIDID